jgi:hypothetical protein
LEGFVVLEDKILSKILHENKVTTGNYSKKPEKTEKINQKVKVMIDLNIFILFINRQLYSFEKKVLTTLIAPNASEIDSNMLIFKNS